jgi:broad specificity phosphatase PhoE
MQRLILIRHARPRIDYTRRLSSGEAAAVLAVYNSAHDIVPSEPELSRARQLLNEGLVLASPSPRVRATVDALQVGASQCDPLFLEADLAIPRLPGLCMRFERWLVVSRSLWLVGVRGQATETFGAAWSRSKVAYGRLLEAGAERGVVALVGHNFFSRCLAWHARAEGWRLTERSGSGYLSSSVYARIPKRA